MKRNFFSGHLARAKELRRKHSFGAQPFNTVCLKRFQDRRPSPLSGSRTYLFLIDEPVHRKAPAEAARRRSRCKQSVILEPRYAPTRRSDRFFLSRGPDSSTCETCLPNPSHLEKWPNKFRNIPYLIVPSGAYEIVSTRSIQNVFSVSTAPKRNVVLLMSMMGPNT